MDNPISIEALMEEVNPVYMTAQRCLQIVARLGDKDSIQLCSALGLPELEKSLKGKDKIPRQLAETLELVMPVFNAIPEARFLASTKLILDKGVHQVVDLPCGYTARGIKLAKSNIRYFGFDLPAAAEALGTAVTKVIGNNAYIKYCAVDATNYNSLRKALGDAEGELFITTEGLLMYFTQNELETVFGNIRKLLSEFGGRWVTIDSELDFAQKAIMKLLCEDLPKEQAEQVGPIVSRLAESMSKTKLLNNILYDPDNEKAKQFVSDMGFDMEIIPMKEYLPESLDSFKGLPEDIRKKAMDALASVNFWAMTVKPKIKEEFNLEEKSFKADVKLSDGMLKIVLSGRLDTITAPGLLSLYKEIENKDKIDGICIDMKNLEYISSAGLRVLLIIRKGIRNGANLSLVNMTDTVREIIETTGFDTIMC